MIKIHYGANRLAALVLLLVIALVASPGYAVFGFGDDDDKAVEGRSVWRSGEQYVSIVPAEEAGNQHPVDIDPGLLNFALSRIIAKEERRLLYYGQYEPIPLLQPQMASTLAKALHKALAAATEAEEVTFLIQGTYRELSVLRNVRGTTGRVFLRDGRLNIIFGEILHSDQEDSGNINADLRGLDYETRRAARYKSASRSRSVDSGWELVAADNISLHSGAGDRSDWIELDIKAMMAAYDASVAEQKAATGAEDAVQQEERRQMLLDMARMRKDIKELREESGNNAAAGSDSSSDSSSGGDASDVKRRLQTLEVLYENELITEDEYQAKRSEIIESI